MSSEQLADGVNPLDAELAATWDVLKGYSGRDTDLGIARRFGGAAAAYSLRDIGAMNGSVVRVRREPNDTTASIDDEERFSANQVQSGALEDWVNGKLESTLPADVATAAAAYSLRKVKASYSGSAVRIRRSSDDIEVDVAFDSDGKVSASSAITNVAEQGGESGQTTDTTLGDFISGTDAFVHTWYDQAGSNNAVQATAANQPKIAENGALLADGLKFNGNSDNFTITNGVSGRSIFAVTNQNIDTTAGGATGYGQDGISSLLGTAGTNSYIFISNNNSAFNSYAISLDGAASDSGQYASNGKTLSSAGGNLGTYGDIPSDANSLLSIIYSSGDPAFDWTRLGSGINGNIFMQGSMSEVILYTTDQSANRFKIESNINNYYGLYNDANDLAGNFTVNSSGTGTDASISNESKTGFTATVVDKAGFFGVDLNETVPNGSNLYISFNANLSPSGGTAATPNFGLANSADKTGNSTGNPLDTAVTEGFNSITVAGTASTCDRIRFTEGNDNVSFIISDLKVSRIARNGFVETWYDQSGNGEDMTQGTAGNQPSIVRNGGQVKDYNGNNSIDFVSGSTRVLDKSGTTTAKTCIVVLDEDSSGSAARAILGFSDSTSFMRLDTTTDLEVKAGGGTANYRAISADTTSLYFWYTNGTDEDKLFENNVEISDTLSYTPPNLPFTRIGARNSDADPYNSRITEIIAFAEDLSSDRTVLQDDVNNNYNIF